MIPERISKLKEIIEEMENDSEQVPAGELKLWYEFFAKLNPDNNLENILLPTKVYNDMTEIIELAENLHFPDWYILPKFTDDPIVLEYGDGDLLTEESPENLKAPKKLQDFFGKIILHLNLITNEYHATDISSKMSFMDKMLLLKDLNFSPPDYISFPTQKITKVSRESLESAFERYVSEVESKGWKVDGVVIASDSDLFPQSLDFNNSRIAYQCGQK